MKFLFSKGIIILFTLILFFTTTSFTIQDKFYEIESLMYFDCYEEALDSILVIRLDFLNEEEKLHYTFLKGETFLFLSKYNQSLEEFLFVYQSPNNAFTNKAKSRLAYLFYMSGDYEKSMDLINEIPMEDHSYSDKIVLAKSHTELKHFNIAHRMYDELLDQKKSDYNFLQKANCYIKQNEYQEAIDIYYQLINDDDEIHMVFYNNLLYCLNKTNPYEASEIYEKVDNFISKNDHLSSQRLGVYYQNKAEYLSFLNCHKDAVNYINKAILIYFGVDDLLDIDLVSHRDKKSLLDFYEEKIKILKNAESNVLLSEYQYIDEIIYYLKMEAVEDNIHYRKSRDYNKYYKEAFTYFVERKEYENAYYFINKLKDSSLNQNLLLKKQSTSESKNHIDKLYREQYHEEIDNDTRNKLRVEALSYFNEANEKRYFDRFDLKVFQKKLDKADLVLDYYFIDSISYVFAISKEKILIHQLSVEHSLINEMKTEFTSKPIMDSWTDEYENKLRMQSMSLYNQLIPFEIEGYRNLVVIPQSILHGLPFEVLIKEQSYLLYHAHISYSSSIKLLDKLLTESYESNVNLLFSVNNQTYLMGSSSEKNELISCYNFKKGDEILKKPQLEFYANILHFTDHAVSSELHLESNIQIDSTRVFKVRDFLLTDIKTNLLVLAGCETGVGEVIGNEGVYGLSRSGFISGAKSIISSFHHINDDSTAEIMKSIYGFINLGYSVNESVSLGKRMYLENESNYYQHPYFWSGLVLEGNYKIKPIKKRKRLMSILI